MLRVRGRLTTVHLPRRAHEASLDCDGDAVPSAWCHGRLPGIAPSAWRSDQLCIGPHPCRPEQSRHSKSPGGQTRCHPPTPGDNLNGPRPEQGAEHRHPRCARAERPARTADGCERDL